jgi:hypothetical protein
MKMSGFVRKPYPDDILIYKRKKMGENMKKITGLFFAVLMAFSVVFIAPVQQTQAQTRVVVRKRRTGGVVGGTVRGTKYIGRKTWHGAKWVGRNTKNGATYAGRKTVQGTKFTGRKVRNGSKSVWRNTRKVMVGH